MKRQSKLASRPTDSALCFGSDLWRGFLKVRLDLTEAARPGLKQHVRKPPVGAPLQVDGCSTEPPGLTGPPGQRKEWHRQPPGLPPLPLQTPLPWVFSARLRLILNSTRVGSRLPETCPCAVKCLYQCT